VTKPQLSRLLEASVVVGVEVVVGAKVVVGATVVFGAEVVVGATVVFGADVVSVVEISVESVISELPHIIKIKKTRIDLFIF
jgi:UDP-3-O-[3-hydroxymyristoyl] glucosamine N-acyltransferase